MLVSGQADAHDVVRAHGLADGAEHLEREPAAVLEAAAIGVGTAVERGRKELVDQVPPGDHLDPVQPALLAAPRPGGISGEHALDLMHSIVLGNDRCWRSRTGLGARVGSQSATSSQARRPICVIWHMSAQSCRWTVSASSWNHGMIASLEALIWPKAEGLSGAVVVDPPNMVSASPPLAFSS